MAAVFMVIRSYVEPVSTTQIGRALQAEDPVPVRLAHQEPVDRAIGVLEGLTPDETRRRLDAAWTRMDCEQVRRGRMRLRIVRVDIGGNGDRATRVA